MQARPWTNRTALAGGRWTHAGLHRLTGIRNTGFGLEALSADDEGATRPAKMILERLKPNA